MDFCQWMQLELKSKPVARVLVYLHSITGQRMVAVELKVEQQVFVKHWIDLTSIKPVSVFFDNWS